jgi:hypothetical protein
VPGKTSAIPAKRLHWEKLDGRPGYYIPGVADLVFASKSWWLCLPDREPIKMGKRSTFDDAEAIMSEVSHP